MKPSDCDDQNRHPGRKALLIFFGFLALYTVNGRSITEVDCLAAPYAAWAIVQHGSFDVSEYPRMQEAEAGGPLRRLGNGQLISKYPPGSTLSAVPAVALFALFSDPLKPSRMERLGKHIASVYVAAAVVLLYLIVVQIAPKAAAPAVIVAGAGSSLWSTASQGLWAHGPATFFLTLSFWLLIRNLERVDARIGVLAGLSMGMAIINRPTVALFAVATIGAFVLMRKTRGLTGFGLGLAGPGLFLLSYNFYYFGNYAAGGYLGEAGLWTTPLLTGLAGLLIAPSRGLLAYSPAFMIVPFSLMARPRSASLSSERWTLIMAWLLACLATLLLYAKWHAWWGGWSFGPRFTCEMVPALTLGLALGWERLTSSQNRKVLIVLWSLVFVSVAIHFIGIFGYHSAWMTRHTGGIGLFSFHDTQIAARFIHLVEDRPASLLIPAFWIAGWFSWRRFRRNPGP